MEQLYLEMDELSTDISLINKTCLSQQDDNNELINILKDIEYNRYFELNDKIRVINKVNNRLAEYTDNIKITNLSISNAIITEAAAQYNINLRIDKLKINEIYVDDNEFDDIKNTNDMRDYLINKLYYINDLLESCSVFCKRINSSLCDNSIRDGDIKLLYQEGYKWSLQDISLLLNKINEILNSYKLVKIVADKF